jgi:hypothetical protein
MSTTRIFIVAGALLVLGAVNFSIAGKERIKRDGEVIYLDLAPVDPRSLMQGDYMTLRFRLATEIQARFRRHPSRAGPREGEQRLADVVLDNRRVARLARAGTPRPTSCDTEFGKTRSGSAPTPSSSRKAATSATHAPASGSSGSTRRRARRCSSGCATRASRRSSCSSSATTARPIERQRTRANPTFMDMRRHI